jgi:hypothetical protein
MRASPTTRLDKPFAQSFELELTRRARVKGATCRHGTHSKPNMDTGAYRAPQCPSRCGCFSCQLSYRAQAFDHCCSNQGPTSRKAISRRRIAKGQGRKRCSCRGRAGRIQESRHSLISGPSRQRTGRKTVQFADRATIKACPHAPHEKTRWPSSPRPGMTRA